MNDEVGNKKLNSITRAVLWILVYGFIISFLHPELLIKDTPVTGGDMASHYSAAAYFNEHILSQGRVTGWNPGNYAGFPLFQFYFPAPFVLIGAISLIIPFGIAFKLVSLAGVLSLPAAVYILLKSMGFSRATGDLGGAFTLVFLFMESNSAWGGNIPSTLAGEFTYSIGLGIGIIYLGRLYRDIDENKNVLINSLLLALVGMCHGYVVLFCVLGAAFFLITTRNWSARAAYILEVNILAFCLMGFWIVPLLLFTPYNTVFNFVWVIGDWRDVIPAIMQPFAAAAIIFGIWEFFRKSTSREEKRRFLFFAYLIAAATIFYFIAFKIGVVDVRFIPFGQIFLVITGAAAVGEFLCRYKNSGLIVLMLTVLTCFWSAYNETYIEKWAGWNYSGYEDKPLWEEFNLVANSLKGEVKDPRVAVEHNSVTAGTGTVRAFESLPYFTGRSTLEGAYIQACLSSPYVFYIQSEISGEISAPLNRYVYSRFNLNRALKHFNYFNVGHYVTASEEARLEAMETDGFVLEKRAGPFSVFRVKTGEPGYVIQPEFKPVLAFSEDPKRDGFAWFRWSDLKVPLVFGASALDAAPGFFADVLSAEELPDMVRNLKRTPLQENNGISSIVLFNEIRIKGAKAGRPLWIRISYHPNWRVEGAEKVWRADPFMMIFPESSEVRMFYGRTWPDYLGLGLSILGLLYALMLAAEKYSGWQRPEILDVRAIIIRAFKPAALIVGKKGGVVLWGLGSAVCAAVFILIVFTAYQDPVVYYNRGMRLFESGEYEQARAVFDEALQVFPLSSVAGATLHFKALTYFKEKKLKEASLAWQGFDAYPESRFLPEASFHLGLCYMESGDMKEARRVFMKTTSLFPGNAWADEAGKKLAELEELEWEKSYKGALELFNQGEFKEAGIRFRALAGQALSKKKTARATLYMGHCLLKDGDLAGAANKFALAEDLDDRGMVAAEAGYYLGYINYGLGKKKAAEEELLKVVDNYPDTVWRTRAKDMLIENRFVEKR